MDRNIVNHEEIALYLSAVQQSVRSPRVAEWIPNRLRGYLLKHYEGIRVVQPLELLRFFSDVPEWASGRLCHAVLLEQPLSTLIEEVVDYLESDQGRQINLTRLSFVDAVRRARVWHREIATKVAADEEQVEDLIVYPDGWRWVKLTTPACLDREGHRMGHCIGGGGFDYDIVHGIVFVYSLRDAKNEPHVTVQTEKLRIEQVKGKQNQPPTAKYRAAVIDLFARPDMRRLQGFSCSDLPRMGLFASRRGIGEITKVADKSYAVSDGMAYHMILPPSPYSGERGYLFDSNDENILITHLNGAFIDHIYWVMNLSIDQKPYRNAIRDVIGRHRAVSKTTRGELLFHFGLITSDHTSLPFRSLRNAPEMRQVGCNDDFTVFYGKEDEVILIVDQDEHPHVSIRVQDSPCGEGQLSALYLLCYHSMRRAVPLMLSVFKSLKVTHSVNIQRVLLKSGWDFGPSDWVDVIDVCKDKTPLVATEQGGWYQHGDNLYLIVGDDIPVRFTTAEENGRLVLKQFDHVFLPVSEQYRPDIITLLRRVPLTKHYNKSAFLIPLNIYARDAEFEQIPLDEVVEITNRYYNELGHFVGTVQYQKPLRSVLNILQVPISLQDDFFPAFYDQGKVEYCKPVRLNMRARYYDNESKYRHEHDIVGFLPRIAEQRTSITRIHK